VLTHRSAEHEHGPGDEIAGAVSIERAAIVRQIAASPRGAHPAGGRMDLGTSMFASSRDRPCVVTREPIARRTAISLACTHTGIHSPDPT
jgi:hypothetical protein